MSGSSRRRIALGIDPYLDEFATKHQAESWKQSSWAAPLDWKDVFLELMGDPTVEAYFNLQGVNVWPGVYRASQSRGAATDWELLQIQQNPSWWPRIVWIEHDRPATNPFA